MYADTKTCTKCGQTKPVSEYYKHGPRLRPDCKDCVKARIQDARDADREHARSIDSRRHQKHRAKRVEAMRKWWALNSEKQNARRRVAYSVDPAPFAERNARRRALRKAVDYQPVPRDAVFERDNGICRICQCQLDPDNWHLDHIVPIALGGPHTWNNLQALCPPCNWDKGKRLEGQIALPL